MIQRDTIVFHGSIKALVYGFGMMIAPGKEQRMLHAIFAILCGGGVFLLANATRNRGWAVSDQICIQGAAFCDNPGLIVVVGIILVILAAIHLMVKV